MSIIKRINEALDEAPGELIYEHIFGESVSGPEKVFKLADGSFIIEINADGIDSEIMETPGLKMIKTLDDGAQWYAADLAATQRWFATQALYAISLGDISVANDIKKSGVPIPSTFLRSPKTKALIANYSEEVDEDEINQVIQALTGDTPKKVAAVGKSAPSIEMPKVSPQGGRTDVDLLKNMNFIRNKVHADGGCYFYSGKNDRTPMSPQEFDDALTNWKEVVSVSATDGDNLKKFYIWGKGGKEVAILGTYKTSIPRSVAVDQGFIK